MIPDQLSSLGREAVTRLIQVRLGGDLDHRSSLGLSDKIGEFDRSKPPDVYAYIVLATERLQSTMAMAMKVDSALPQIAPSAEGVVAQHEPHAIDCHFCICLHAAPFIAFGHRSIVVVADNEILVAIQRGEQELYAFS
jgi:hypothetical protein